jgi:TRAP-type C4-dicarboxylate transport system permease small subunit
MKPGKIFGLTERGIHGLTKVGSRVAAAALFLMMLLVAADVIGRYVFSKPIKGAMEIDELMMVLVVFLVLAYCTLEKGHIRVELLLAHLSRRTQAILDSFTYLSSLGIVALFVWQMGMLGWQELFSPTGNVSLLLAIPEAPLLLLAAICCVLLCFELIIAFLQSLAQVSSRQVDK